MHEASWGPLKGALSAQKALEVNYAEQFNVGPSVPTIPIEKDVLG